MRPVRLSDGLNPHDPLSGPYHPRHRAPVSRRRAGVWTILLAVVVALVLSGPAGPTAPAFAATDQPTVSFLGSGPAPLACSSHPSVSNMTVKKDTRIVLANFTGADATVDLGSGVTTAVADGDAISVKLKEGTYMITMSPACLETFEVQATVITVVKALPAPSSPAPAGPAPSDPARTGPQSPSLDSVAAGPPAGAPGPAGPAGTAAGPPVAVGPDVPGQADLADPSDPNAELEPDIQQASASRPVSAPDARGARLLALIAAICVFGVTSAIIRAIVAERATGALSTA